jgi:RHS repeat-associated protein
MPIYMYGHRPTTVEQISNSTGQVLYMHHDQQGSTRLLTGSTGKVEGKCSYSAYGAPTCEGTATTPLGYDAQYTSADTGLVYMRAREYDPATGQFVSRDPVTDITWEPYSYAWDNPVNNGDPTGLSAEGIEGVPCYFPFCGPTPAGAPSGAGTAEEVVRQGLEKVTHGLESAWGFINEAEGPNDEGGAIVRQQAEAAEQASQKECGQESPRSLPYQGEPNSTSALDRGNGSGQIRDYGPDGLPLRDFDFGHDHGFGDPHVHEWLEGVRGPGRPLGSNE